MPLKIGKFNRIFPEEYTGELYAGRLENGWVVYNGLSYIRNAVIPFKYNTCDRMELAFSKYTVAVVKEYANKVTFYMSNYDTGGFKKTDVIKIHGCTSTPSYSLTARAQGTAQVVSEDWNDGVYTLTVNFNGPLDLTINCSGNATERESQYITGAVSAPARPQIYQGAHQYEAEYFDYKNGIIAAGKAAHQQQLAANAAVQSAANAAKAQQLSENAAYEAAIAAYQAQIAAREAAYLKALGL